MTQFGPQFNPHNSPGGMPGGPQNSQEDNRNMIIFFIISTILILGFYALFIEPAQEAKQAARELAAQQQVKLPDGTVEAFTNSVTNTVDRKLPREAILQSETGRIPFENDFIAGSINLKGGRIDDLVLRKHFETLDKEKPIALFSPAGADYPHYADFGWLSVAGSTLDLPQKSSKWRVLGPELLSPDTPVKLGWTSAQNVTFTKTYSLDRVYGISVELGIENQSGQSITVFPYGSLARRGVPQDFAATFIMHEGPITWANEGLNEVSYKKLRKGKNQDFSSIDGWIGFSQKYWLAAFMPEQSTQKTYNLRAFDTNKPGTRPLYQADLLGEALMIPTGQSSNYTLPLYAGTKRSRVLDQYAKEYGIPHLDMAIDYGMLYFLTRPFQFLLLTFYDFAQNFGLAILMLTLCIRALLFPLAHTSYKSFAKLKKVAPKMTELREKFGDDKVRMQQELVKLYQKENVNPAAGCLPVLLQIPIFFAMYKVIYVTTEMRHAPFFGWIKDLSAQDPTTVFNLFGLLPYDVPGFLMIGAWPCLMMIFLLIQQRLNPPPTDPIQKTMMTYFPFMMTFILAKFPAGLVIYWTMSNMISVIQQASIMKMMGVPIHLFGEKDSTEQKLERQIEDGPIGVMPKAQMIKENVEDAVILGEEKPTKSSKTKKASKKSAKPKKKKT